MNVIKKLSSHLAKEQRLLKDNEMEVKATNRKMLVVVFALAFGIYLTLLIVSLFVELYKELTVPYLIMAVLYGALLFIVTRKGFLIQPEYMLYFGYALFSLYCFYTNRFITQDYVSVMILTFLFIIQLLTLDRTFYINAFVLGVTALYLAFVIPYKNPVIATDDCINITTVAIASAFIGHYLRFTRLENIDLRRRSAVMSVTDELTGLSNRRKLFETLTELKSDASGNPCSAIAMIDVDIFKDYNDSCGHQAGDRCLYDMARCFEGIESEYGVMFYRYGGEEFIALFAEDGKTIPYDVCLHINQKVFGLKIPHINNPTGFVTLSIGLAAVDTTGVFEYQMYISHADKAVYEAKANGRNRTVVYSGQPGTAE